MWSNIAAKLNILKDSKEITLSQLAKVANMTLPHLSNYLSQRQQSLPLEAVVSICDYFGVTIDDFIKAPLEGFSLESLQQKKAGTDAIRNDIDKVIDEIYVNLNPDERVWLKVEITRFVKALPKTI